MEKFNEGDVVQLKSGGPKMTVEKIDDLGVYCYWFKGGTLQHSCLEPHTLNKKKETDE